MSVLALMFDRTRWRFFQSRWIGGFPFRRLGFGFGFISHTCNVSSPVMIDTTSTRFFSSKYAPMRLCHFIRSSVNSFGTDFAGYSFSRPNHPPESNGKNPQLTCQANRLLLWRSVVFNFFSNKNNGIISSWREIESEGRPGRWKFGLFIRNI